MRFYTKLQKHYCGIDLHTNKMYPCVLDNNEDILLHKKIGNAHLRRVFSQAAQLFLKNNDRGKRFHARLCNKHGEGKALSI